MYKLDYIIWQASLLAHIQSHIYNEYMILSTMNTIFSLVTNTVIYLGVLCLLSKVQGPIWSCWSCRSSYTLGIEPSHFGHAKTLMHTPMVGKCCSENRHLNKHEQTIKWSEHGLVDSGDGFRWISVTFFWCNFPKPAGDWHWCKFSFGQFHRLGNRTFQHQNLALEQSCISLTALKEQGPKNTTPGC